MSENGAVSEVFTRLQRVRARIRDAALRAGRDPDSVALVAVSKTVPAAGVLAAARAGQIVFGENRVQEALEKIPRVSAAWPGPLTWRMIGHLQRNKVRQALRLFDTVDSVDSLRLLDTLVRQAEERPRPLPILIEFNCSGDAGKSGFPPGEWEDVVRRLRESEALVAEGLMTVGPLEGGPEAARAAFRRLARLREVLQDSLGSPLPVLSMGMSADLEVGVEEGATLVRVGTAVFGPRSPSE